MRPAYTAEQIRSAEAPLLEAGVELMHRAAYGLYTAAAEMLGAVYGADVVLLVGKGNNGGDALYAGELLSRRGARTTAVLTMAASDGSPAAHREALAAFVRAGGKVRQLSSGSVAGCAILADSADLLIDGILGTGARGGLRSLAADLVGRIDPRAVLACDVPSGVNSTTGEVSEPVLRADVTVTFGAAKAGLVAPPGSYCAGEVRVVDIGLPLPEPDFYSLEPGDALAWWPRPGTTSQKYSRGVLGVIAGSAQYPGAAILSVHAALAAGSGMLRYLGPHAVAEKLPPEVVSSESVPNEEHVQAWLVGPGMVGDQTQDARCAQALASGLPVVADAGALSQLPARCSTEIVLTPHAGELATLLTERGEETQRADVEREPLAHARRAVELTGATVLLKGATTLVVSPSGPTYSVSHGTGWLATAGSGDSLAGILGALLACGVEPAQAAAMAASVHGQAGVLASRGGTVPIHASQLAAAVTDALARDAL